MIRRIGALTRAVAALAVAVTLVVAIPAALVSLVGWPLPTAWPTLDQLRGFAQVGVTDETIVKALAVVVWIAWAQVALAIVVETVAVARRRAARPLPVLPGVQPFAARLVAAMALVAATTATTRTGAMAMPLQAVVATASAAVPVDAGADHSPPEPEAAVPPAEAAPTITVTTTVRDSWWRLAERHLGDGMRWREIRDLNRGEQVAPGVVIDAGTDQLQSGWRVEVPASADPGPSEPAERSSAEPDVGEWTVEPGDHFWHIAEHALTDAWDRAPTDAEVTPYWSDLVDANRDRLAPPGDRDLIHPGQEFTLPPAPGDPLTPTRPGPSEPTSRGTPTHLEPPSDRDASTPADFSDVRAPDRVSDGWQATIGRHADRPATGGDTSAADTGGPDDALVERGDADERNGLGVPVGLAAGAAAASLLAASITTLLRWRRRAALRGRPEGYRLPTPLVSTEAEITRLEAAAVDEQTLDDLAALLASIPSQVHPALVTAADDGTVTLLFDDTAPVPEAPSPWAVADDGADGPVGWTARLGDVGPARSIGLPLLITLGRTGTATVLANVGAMSRLTIAGPDDACGRRLRTMALEVATSRLAVPVEAIVVGDDHLASLDAVRQAEDPSTVVEAARAQVRHGVVAEDRSLQLLLCHRRVVAPDVPAELFGTVGVVSTAERPATGWTLVVDDDETARLLLPDGGSVVLALPDLDPAAIGQELDRLHDGPAPASQPPVPAEAVHHGDGADETDQPDDPLPDLGGNGQLPTVAVGGTTERAWCEVRLLGPTDVVRDGARIDGITPRTMEVLAYLVTHRDGVTKERLDDAVWSGRAARPGSQRVTSALTKLRDALGEGPDDEPLVPRRTGSERIRLSDHVGSDLDRAFAHLAVARDLPADLRLRELTAALELVRGEPFEDLPVSWASDVTQRAIAELQDAALEVARSCRRLGDFDAAERAVRQGLRLLDPADVLYLEFAEVEKARGRPDRVATVWRELRRRHAADADEIGGLVTAPPPEIELAFQNLLTPTA